MRQLLTESLVLTAVGGAFGRPARAAVIPLLVRLVPNGLPIAEAPTLDLRMLAVALAITALTGIGFGLAPALRVVGRVDTSALREGRAGASRSRERMRSALVTVEVVLSMVLMIATGLLLRALWQVQAVNYGLRGGGLLRLRTSPPMPRCEKMATRHPFYSQVSSEARALGVAHAAYTSWLPMVWRGSCQCRYPAARPSPPPRRPPACAS